MDNNNQLEKLHNPNKTRDLIISIIFDLIGMLSYSLPVLGETIDFIWAPISGFVLMALYKGLTGKVAGIIGFIEEIFPGLDFIPTFTLTWIYKYYFQKK